MDTLVLAGATLAVLGYGKSQTSIFDILSISNNGGSIDQATDKKDSGGIGNYDPNLCGSGMWQEMSTDMPPLPVYKKGPLDSVGPNHPGFATPLIRNLALSSNGY